MEKNNNLNNRTLTIEKTFDIPIDLVWEAWTDSEHVAKWWAPYGMSLEVLAYNFTIGGKWKYAMSMPDGNQFISEGVFKEIVNKKKIISSADFIPMTEDVELHISFEADGDQTYLTFSVIHATEEYCKQQEKMGFYNGWGSAFDRLESVLNNLVQQ
ncbi:MAG: SRPBCC domain-containing protein [Bacteroidota bacterium]